MSQQTADQMQRETLPQYSQNSVHVPAVLNIDFIKIAWNKRWLLLLGIILGIGGGYFYYTHSEPIYRSSAQIKIIDPIEKNMPVEQLEAGFASRDLGDEILALRSEHLLQRAASLGELGSSNEFVGKDALTIAATLSSSRELVVAPASESSSTSVLVVQYDSPSPLDSQRVVRSVVDAYEAHLRQEYQNVGQETLDLIQTARNEVSNKLNSLEKEISEFWKTSGLIYRGDAVMSVHRDNADKFLAEKQRLEIRQAELRAVLESAREAVAAKSPLESVLIALRQAATMADNPKADDPRASWEIERLKTTPVVSTADKLRQQMLLPLEMEKETLIESFGVGHPIIDSISKQIRVLKESINRIGKAEQERIEDLDKAMVSAETERGIVSDPVERLKADLRNAVAAIRQQLAAVDKELLFVSQAYQKELTFAKNESDVELKSMQLERERERQQMLYDRIVERLDEVNMISSGRGLRLFRMNTAKLGVQVEPSLAKSLLLGGFMGMMLAAGLALLSELSDRSYAGPGELSRHMQLPIVGHVPVLTPAKVARKSGSELDRLLCTHFDPTGRQSETFRAIRTALYFGGQYVGGPGSANQILQVTSAVPAEGKTTVATNLAVAMAQSGRSVLLLDADLRRSRVCQAMGLSESKGVAWVIDQARTNPGHMDLIASEAIYETEVDNLSVMPAGTRPENPSELLSSAAFDQLLAFARGKFDMVIIDSPPMLAVSDPSTIATRVDAVLLVVRLKKNIKPATARAAQMLQSLDANVAGVIVNGIGSRAARGYGKGGESQNGSDPRAGGYGFGFAYGGGADAKIDRTLATYYKKRPTTRGSQHHESDVVPASSDSRDRKVLTHRR